SAAGADRVGLAAADRPRGCPAAGGRRDRRDRSRAEPDHGRGVLDDALGDAAASARAGRVAEGGRARGAVADAAGTARDAAGARPDRLTDPGNGSIFDPRAAGYRPVQSGPGRLPMPSATEQIVERLTARGVAFTIHEHVVARTVADALE